MSAANAGIDTETSEIEAATAKVARFTMELVIVLPLDGAKHFPVLLDLFMYKVINLNGLQQDRQNCVHAMKRSFSQDEWLLVVSMPEP